MNKDEEAIHGLVARFVDAWNHHDARAFTAVFAEDADFTNVHGTTASGHAAIEKLHSQVFSTIFKDSHQTSSVPTIRFIKPDVAAVDVRWQMTGSTNPDGSPNPKRNGLLNFVMTESNAEWRIAVMHNTELTGVPAR
ncbi:MAG: SgcJ/EcaC family oxidoreductase [Candidatus Acidiferrales bacterium]